MPLLQPARWRSTLSSLLPVAAMQGSACTICERKPSKIYNTVSIKLEIEHSKFLGREGDGGSAALVMGTFSFARRAKYVDVKTMQPINVLQINSKTIYSTYK